MVDRINRRYNAFVEGSSRLEDAGVLVHGIDFTEDPDRPWAVCPTSSSDCGFLSDRMSASLIWKVKGTAAFSGGGGVILNPNATRLLCIYGGDGGTRGKTCSPPGASDRCLPGCVASYRDAWCDASGARSSWCDGHPWRPSELGTFVALDGGSAIYNEAIVDGFYWNAHLPHSIEALIGSPGDPAAVRLHERFLRTYRLTAEDVPLVIFEKDKPDCPFRPFDARPEEGVDPNERLDYKVDGTYRQWVAPPPPSALADEGWGSPDAALPMCWFGRRGDGGAGGVAAPPPESPAIDLAKVELPALVIGR